MASAVRHNAIAVPSADRPKVEFAAACKAGGAPPSGIAAAPDVTT
jgi:hypothetical protein